MKTILMHVSDEFYAALREVADGRTQVDGMGFVIDGVHEEPMFSEAEGEDIAVMTCNLACAKWAFVTHGEEARRTIEGCDRATADRLKRGASNECPTCCESRRSERVASRAMVWLAGRLATQERLSPSWLKEAIEIAERTEDEEVGK